VGVSSRGPSYTLGGGDLLLEHPEEAGAAQGRHLPLALQELQALHQNAEVQILQEVLGRGAGGGQGIREGPGVGWASGAEPVQGMGRAIEVGG